MIFRLNELFSGFGNFRIVVSVNGFGYERYLLKKNNWLIY